jgi:hypothetical protein
MMVPLRKAALVTAGVAAVGGLVFGAASAFAASPASTPAASSTPAAGASPAKKAGKGDDVRRDARQHRARLFKNGAHGQATVKDKSGQWVVHEWQVGKVGSVNGSTVTVTDGSGTTWTWTVVSGAKVRVSGAAAALSAVKAGDTVLMTGVQSAGANDARAVFDPNQSKLG